MLMSNSTMLAARLHGPSDLRIDHLPHPGAPERGEVLLRVRVTGLCGSDLHSYQDARIGDTPVQNPMILGHEFSARVDTVGSESTDGLNQPLQPGARVAVDPAQPCGHCELCQRGHPNLCRHLSFCGNFPVGGSLCEWMRMPAHCCFPMPDEIDDEEAALLEPLGVAIHAVDLARLRVAQTVVILGAGPIGLLLLEVARLAGAGAVWVSDPLSWRLQKAQALGGRPLLGTADEILRQLHRETEGRGVDVVIEAAWGGDTVAQAAELVCLGGRVVLVGIPSDDRLTLKHSTARRKGLTIAMSRRMKHCYPRALDLARQRRIDLKGLISHRFSLQEAVEAFRLNAAYKENVVKVMVSS
jgi:L-iditol 2-dehydrogenase